MIQLPMRLRRFFVFLRQTLTIPDVADQQAVLDYVRSDTEFRGAKAWILILAVLVASLGLNVNSTAVIIGAMLISPLMGPIIGLGVAVGITDRNMFFRSIRHLATATLLSLVASTLYFLISPFDQADSELLARTTPTLLDALIAITGGAAGAIAMVRLDKSNVVPGVAIATALMPPLCTAGYAISQWNMEFFVGAFYLFFINSVYIAASTFLVVRLMRFDHVTEVEPLHAKRNVRILWVIVVATLVPSVYTGWNMFRRQAFEQAVATLRGRAEDVYPGTSFVVTRAEWRSDTSIAVLTLIGEELEEGELNFIRELTQDVGLEDAKLELRQSQFMSYVASSESASKMRSKEMSGLYQQSLRELHRRDSVIDVLLAGVANVDDHAIADEAVIIDSRVRKIDVVLPLVYVTFSTKPTKKQVSRLQDWLRIRLANDTILVRPVIL